MRLDTSSKQSHIFTPERTEHMAKTYEQMCREARNDIESDGIYHPIEAGILYDFAESLLDDPEFRKLAKAKFPLAGDQTLRECVADSLASA